jgi:hypothetical protein
MSPIFMNVIMVDGRESSNNRHHDHPVGHDKVTVMTMARWPLRGLAAAALLLLLAVPAGAQLGVPNPPVPPAGPEPPPFGSQPHPFNNPHPALPWAGPWKGIDVPVRVIEVPARTVVLPMVAAEPGSPTGAVELREVTLPGYVVTETTRGWVVHEHWGVEPADSVYRWTWRPTYFVAK